MITESLFKPWRPLRNPHLQTLFASQVRRSPPLAPRRERIELPDGDFIDADWVGEGTHPIVVVLHGLTGSIESKYARGLMATVQRRGWRGVLMHFRGCSGEPNRLARSYHSGDTADIDHFMRLLRHREPHTPLALVGYSLGGNVTLKWLGEQGGDAPLQAAVAVSVPFDLASAAQRLRRGLSRIYQDHLLHAMRRQLEQKLPLLPAEIRARARERLPTFHAFDDAITAPLHGFTGADDYYRRASCRPFIARIRRPTLVLHARDDPFMLAAAIPGADQVPDPVTLELSSHGGHVGFVGGHGTRPSYWLEQRIPEFLEPLLCPPAGAAPVTAPGGESPPSPEKIVSTAAFHEKRPQDPGA